ncbi:MAG: DUF3276 family protein [Ignavibacteriaceae bacterium]|jgi:Protein of unknown function (DUF3276).|nr:MAG: DUF3276 family protein [Chlorobiota bacterium]KXK04994.1 MAG: hypothetical protein UZ04_CHB001000882 [Chlorobi bacterium OLB4]MBV6397806.1 hypothetical protein [Ignavibacteria bacterium]MCC6885583.1 DUF3276 family protein [Ignavibacteriales bacterium]MCE7952937.1 DUF3276 family protein [Chlorobi bacterium CHB7]MDL1886900.1 DUF3276 family protein [Ignavibacteria bacterium CHB1]MEB2328669.1 DUF3276 family protein [Ignavibacteriaceae bacterium]OQY78611.1 MAG: hypothetical protein B6D43_
MENKKKEAIHKETVKAGSKTYFLNVKETQKGDPYVQIVESTKKDDSYVYNSIMIFDNAIPEFTKAVNKIAGFIENHANSDTKAA